MPSVQGHIPIRRRPNDGKDGIDPVYYNFIPSAGSIVLQKNGTLNPSSISVRLLKHVAESVTDITSQTFDGYAVKKNIVTDGNNTSGYVPGAALNLAPYAKTLKRVEFSLTKGGKTEAFLSVPVLADGSDGVGISKVTEFYLATSLSSGVDIDTKGWVEDDVPALSATNKYLWNYEEIAYTNGKTEQTTPAIIGVYGNDGRGISSVTNYYLATSLSSGVTTDRSKFPGWTTAVQFPTPDKRFLWNYEKIDYTDGTSKTIDPHIIGVYGDDGPPGDDAVSYWLVPSISSVVRSSSGTYTPSKVSCTVMRKIGNNAPTAVTDLFLRYHFTYTNNIVHTWQKYSSEITISGDYCQSIEFELYASGTVLVTGASGAGDCLAHLSIPIIRDGATGGTGPQGIQGCIYRVTEWMSGFEFRNDSESTSDGIRYIDIALIQDSSKETGARAYMCENTHISDSTNSPDAEFSKYPTLDKTEHWRKMNNLAPIYTPMILAKQAVLTLLQSNQVLVMKDDGSTVNVGLGGGKYPLWIGDSDPTNANFHIDDLGRAYMNEAEILGKIIAGILDGQRVELQPDNKAMKIYDVNGDEACSFEGNSYSDIDKLFSTTSGSFVIKTRTETDASYAKGITYGKGSLSIIGNDAIINELTRDIIISNAVQSSTPIEVSVNGYFATYYSLSAEYANSGSSSGSTSTKPVFLKGASAYMSLYVDTYSGSDLKTRIASQAVTAFSMQSGDKTLSNTKAKTSVGGYHVLRIHCRLSASGSGQSARVSWGSETFGKADISGSFVSDFYVSRFFANGFCLGQSKTNYIWAYNQGTAGMRFKMENNGFGVDVSNNGIKLKYHNGNWNELPKLIYRGVLTINSSSASLSYRPSLGFDETGVTVSRIREGVARIIFSDKIKNLGLTLNNCSVHLTGYASTAITSSSSLPILAKGTVANLTSNGMDIIVSDDDSPNDSVQMIIEIWKLY